MKGEIMKVDSRCRAWEKSPQAKSRNGNSGEVRGRRLKRKSGLEHCPNFRKKGRKDTEGG